MHTIKAISIYPIKGLGGISLDSAMAQKEGLQYDRRWMLVDNEGQFLSQRQNANMALFSLQIIEEELVVNYQAHSIRIAIGSHGENIEDVQVWDSKLKGHEVSPEASEWFSQHLGREAKLIKMTAVSIRNKKLLIPPFNTTVSFADGYPFLVLSEASMGKLNGLLTESILIDRFRANIIVSADAAHDEDKWNIMNAGTAQFKVIKPCARCLVTTIDQKTAEKGVEPLKTLASYRKWDNKIWFGANVVLLKAGEITVGDEIRFD